MAGTVRLSAAAKEHRSIALAEFINLAEGDAQLLIYSGSIPASSDDPADPGDVLLASFVCPSPFAVSNTGGVLIGADFDSALAVATGQAGWARIVRGDGSPVADLSVGTVGSGAVVQLPVAEVFAGSIVAIASVNLTEA